MIRANERRRFEPMKINPITVEVVRNAINAYADEMATALCKSAYNMMIYEVRDFCCGLIDAEGRMISQNKGGLPIFLADLGIAVKDGIARYGLDGFAPGDVVIINDNLRFPEAALGDLRAQVACCQLGIRRLGELLTRYGRETVTECIHAVWDATDRAARAFVAKIPNG